MCIRTPCSRVRSPLLRCAALSRTRIDVALAMLHHMNAHTHPMLAGTWVASALRNAQSYTQRRGSCHVASPECAHAPRARGYVGRFCAAQCSVAHAATWLFAHCLTRMRTHTPCSRARAPMLRCTTLSQTRIDVTLVMLPHLGVHTHPMLAGTRAAAALHSAQSYKHRRGSCHAASYECAHAPHARGYVGRFCVTQRSVVYAATWLLPCSLT